MPCTYYDSGAVAESANSKGMQQDSGDSQPIMVAAGIRAVSSSPSTAEQPLQSVSAATGNIQQAEELVSSKARGHAARTRPVSTAAEELSASAKDAANGIIAAADTEESKQEAATPNRTGSKLFAGHEVTSFVVEEEESDCSIHDDGQQTVSTTPYDELD